MKRSFVERTFAFNTTTHLAFPNPFVKAYIQSQDRVYVTESNRNRETTGILTRYDNCVISV